ncbi:MAG: hypothetical protein O3A49_04495 [Candidatus Marinimicrobia bacterium]|nr:hypothetical protein [Candidatus Neomarinimicrobiota bacterium]
MKEFIMFIIGSMTTFLLMMSIRGRKKNKIKTGLEENFYQAARKESTR